jgi:hypothetical protein
MGIAIQTANGRYGSSCGARAIENRPLRTRKIEWLLSASTANW